MPLFSPDAEAREILVLLDPEAVEASGLVDDLVHDIAQDCEAIDVSGAEDPEERADLRSLWASELNNQGVFAQLEWLFSQGVSRAQIAGLLLEIPSFSAHARARLAVLARHSTP